MRDRLTLCAMPLRGAPKKPIRHIRSIGGHVQTSDPALTLLLTYVMILMYLSMLLRGSQTWGPRRRTCMHSPKEQFSPSTCAHVMS